MSRNSQAATAKNARVRGIFVEHVRRDRLLELYDGRCGICNLYVNPRTFDVDHITPASRGGEHSYANCQPTHPHCNRLKANMTEDEFDRFWPRNKRTKRLSYRNHGLARRKRIAAPSARAA